MGYYIISLEAKDIYKQEVENGKNVGYILPVKKSDEYWNLFKNSLDYSLDSIELEKSYEKICRRKFSFEDEFKNRYTLAVINVKFSIKYKDENGSTEVNLKKLRKHFYDNGFNLGGIHYVRYKRSSGSSREGKCLFINEKILRHMSEWGECGLNSGKKDLAAWEAYKSLSLSSIKKEMIDIPLDGILFVNDCKSEFSEDVISVEEKDGVLEASTKETNIDNVIWDGESLLDESLFEKSRYKNKHMLLLRNKFFKSCGFRTKLQTWIKGKNITLEDLKHRGFITFATNVSQIVMVTTKSSMKFLTFMGKELTEENVRKWIDKVDSAFGVVKYDKPTKFFNGRMVQASYQFINTLALNEQQAEQLLKPSKDYLETIRDDFDFMRFHFKKACKGEKDDFEIEDVSSDGLEERCDVIYNLMKCNYGFKDTELYCNFRNKVVETQKNKLKEGHILLSGTNATLFGNGPELLLALSGGFDYKKTDNEPVALSKGEIACTKFKNGEKLVCYRSPHITMGNLYCVTNNTSNDIWKYFDLGDNIVCVNAIGENIQQRLNGCDYDSDAMLITNDEIIVEIAFKQKDNFKVPVCKIETNSREVTLSELDYDTSENVIGEIVNLSQRLNSILWDKLNDGSKIDDVKEIYSDVCKLAVLSGIEIDKAKRTYGSINVQKELKAMANRYNNLYGKVRPNFFEKIDENNNNEKKDKNQRLKKSKKEYAHYKTSMEYIYDSAGKIDYRKGKDKQKEYIAISNMIKEPEKGNSTSYEHAQKIVNVCKRYKDKIPQLYKELRKADADEKELIYAKIKQKKLERKECVERYLDGEYTLYLSLKALEKEQNTNWHLYAPLLESKLFQDMLKISKEQMREVVEIPNGEYQLFNFRFTKI